jgi:quercetin dioxygenase-like cupin family protein
MQKRLYPHWKETVVFSTEGPQPQTLFETEKSRAVIAGLEAGQKIPPHTEGLAIFHYLEGTGQMIVDEEHFPVQTGATVVVPDGARNTLTYNIPAVNCMHCKMTIEREVGELSGHKMRIS